MTPITAPYGWEQHYGIDRFDLSGPKSFPMGSLGWITQCADHPESGVASTVTRDPVYYISYMERWRNHPPPPRGGQEHGTHEVVGGGTGCSLEEDRRAHRVPPLVRRER